MYKIRIGAHDFEWDPRKERANIRKHGISFREAADAFQDELSSLYHDAVHSLDEDRYYLIGMSSRLNLLVVFHCLRSDGLSTRIISARKATNHEKTEYQRHHAA